MIIYQFYFMISLLFLKKNLLYFKERGRQKQMGCNVKFPASEDSGTQSGSPAWVEGGIHHVNCSLLSSGCVNRRVELGVMLGLEAQNSEKGIWVPSSIFTDILLYLDFLKKKSQLVQDTIFSISASLFDLAYSRAYSQYTRTRTKEGFLSPKKENFKKFPSQLVSSCCILF